VSVTDRHPVSPVGLHRVLEPSGVLPQAAWRLDASPDLVDGELRIRVHRLNLDAASFRQLFDKHGGDGTAVRAEVLDIIRTRGKMQNPVTGSGGMLVGVVEEIGPNGQHHGLSVGDPVTTLVSLTLTPLQVDDELRAWDGLSEQVPCDGHAILFGRTIVARVPDDLDGTLAMAVMDVCGAPALTARVVGRYVDDGKRPTVAVIGGAGKSGSLSLAAARRAGAARSVGVVPVAREADALRRAGLADVVALADARDPVALSDAIRDALGTAADIVVVCVDVP
jgi:L-erythro-3,5-diaminohexanoate dehydrogenase